MSEIGPPVYCQGVTHFTSGALFLDEKVPKSFCVAVCCFFAYIKDFRISCVGNRASSLVSRHDSFYIGALFRDEKIPKSFHVEVLNFLLLFRV